MDAGIEPGGSALVERVKAIILKPKEEWPNIASETKSQNEILTSYVLPLAAIGPVASLIGSQVFGYGLFGFSYRPPLVSSIVSAVVSFGLAVLSVFVLAFIANFLAPKFEGQPSKANAFKLVAYGATASWLAGIFGLIPALGVFGLLGLYSLYLFYAGVTPMMKVPEAKALGYTAVTIVCAILLMLVIAPLTAAVTGMLGFGAGHMANRSPDSGGTISLPGGKSFDVGEVEKMGKRMEDAASGKAPPIEAAKLQALLPSSIGPFERTASETMAMGPMGSTAEGTYSSGDQSFKLMIADMSALGALAGLGAAMGVEQTREDADSYERTGNVNGRMQTEAWNKSSNRGKFGTIVKERFWVEAEGHADSIDQLKGAVSAVSSGDLEDLVD